MGEYQAKTNGNSAPSSSLADPVMLSKIDRLFACNVGHHIDLPQIVVVGDQSSGKSSVLEGLTDLPFPRDSGLCTKFATQIIFRRSALKNINVSIVPAKGSSMEHIAKVRAYSKKLEVLNVQSFGEIFHEVNEVMGIAGKSPTKTFSQDVLRLEVSGPEEEHLSVIDIPGIFKRTTSGVTTKEDIQMVKSMVQGYMENPRSVILAVIPANVDIATQEILEMAEEIDKLGERTLGVLTKPDLVDTGAEGNVMDLVEGRKHQLTLGWHLIRNPGQQESSDPSTNRHALETAFFNSRTPYNTLDKDKVGIPSLKLHLQEILTAHTRREFPKVKAELNRKLKGCKSQLESLGTSRDTQQDQSKYLIGIASKFQEIVSLSLSGKYGSDEMFDRNSVLRIATHIVNLSERFSNFLEVYGHRFDFDHAEEEENPDVELKGKATQNTPKAPPHSNSRITKPLDDVEDILSENKQLEKPSKTGIVPWLTTIHREARGFELGTFDPVILATTMKKISSQWEDISLGFVSDAVTLVHEFVTDLLGIICPDGRIRSGLVSVLMDDLFTRYKRTVSQVKFVLQVELSQNPATQNPLFTEQLNKARQKRMQKAALKKAYTSGNDESLAVRVDDLLIDHPMSNVKQTVLDLHDILEAYYMVARRRFVDNICMQVVDHHLIHGPDTPLKLFAPAFVGALSAEQLEEIAGEDPRQKRKRKQLQKEIEDLEMGRKILA